MDGSSVEYDARRRRSADPLFDRSLGSPMARRGTRPGVGARVDQRALAAEYARRTRSTSSPSSSRILLPP